MRKVTEAVITAFKEHLPRKVGNTSTDGKVLKLHGNTIAEYRHGELWITNAGWHSATTKERLNGLPDVSISQRKGEWYLNGVLWNGEWVKIG